MNNTITKAIDELKTGTYNQATIEAVVNHLNDYTEEDEELLFVLGDLLDSIGEKNYALTIFKYLYESNEHDDNILSYLIDIYITNGDIDNALLLLNEAKETPTVLFLKAEVFQQMHLNDVALKHLMKARSLSNDAIIDFAIAELYYYEGNLTEAIYYYKNTLKTVDRINNININLRLANIYSNLMESEMALSYFNEVEDHELENDDYFLKGLVHFQLEQYNEAEKMLDNVIKNEPYYTNAYILLMKIKEKEYDFEGATELLKDYVVIDDLNPLMFYHLGRLSLKLGSLEDAKGYFKRATELDIEYEDALLKLFQSILESDTTDEINDYIKHLDIKELSPEALHLLGTIEARNENDENAMQYFEEAAKFLKDKLEFLSDYYSYLSEIRDERRVDILQQLIALEPSNPEWQLELERIQDDIDHF
ncbi:hypothetical protein [Nosocomiicoccus sp. HMSC09A07]|uniref:tetratricopeptide repeat protein n=1 Tax=Nosocomiicoccus sp. HMSC09A07 TaxID=1581145 RepID=UPI0008A2602B|nr:hypothetical protein [Nosocomiicoccus sp. HMSC09A07]OFS64247.1 hypothetical protein HMPREF3177_01585 [Nosocomiicoccus sp. HMSC09A07]